MQYPDNKKERRKVLEQEMEQNYLPPLKATNINPENYDIIFLGSPVWGNHISQPIKSLDRVLMMLQNYAQIV